MTGASATAVVVTGAVEAVALAAEASGAVTLELPPPPLAPVSSAVTRASSAPPSEARLPLASVVKHGFHNIDGPTFSEPDRLVFEKNGLEIPNLASAIVSLGLIEDTPILKMKADISVHESSNTEPAASKPVTILVKVMSSQILSALCFQIDIPN